MQTRIQVGVDGSDPALAAVSYVGSIAARVPTVHVRLVHVTPPAPRSLQERGFTYEPLDGQVPERFVDQVEVWKSHQRKRAKHVLEQAREALRAAGTPAEHVEVHVEDGDGQRPSQGLRVTAQRDGYDTLVVGRRGVAMWREFAFGGTTEALLRYPIGLHLWVIEPVTSPSGPQGFLVGIDGSENGIRAVDYLASTLGGADGFNVTLAHVPRRRNREDAQRILDAAYDRLRDKGFRPEQLETRILDAGMKTADALIKDASDNRRETVVIGRRGRSTLREFVFGGVTERLIRYPIGRSVWVVD
jgi:nucleotide-binding universal stress UspA family protein